MGAPEEYPPSEPPELVKRGGTEGTQCKRALYVGPGEQMTPSPPGTTQYQPFTLMHPCADPQHPLNQDTSFHRVTALNGWPFNITDGPPKELQRGASARLEVGFTDHEPVRRVINVLNPQTRLRVVLGLAAALFITVVGLSLYIMVLKKRQFSEPQIMKESAQSRAADIGKDGRVLPPCGDSWIWYWNKCFYFSEGYGDWTEARDSCAALNSSLALIDTQEELDFMFRYKGMRDHWIGLQRETDQQWKWVNGTKFSNWFVVEDYSECAYLNHGRVKSAECYGKRKWICTQVSAYGRKRNKRSLILQPFR
ncbi:C-type lectin domain family 2 member E-like isoform X2 [Pleurodeles waltl]